MNMYEHYLYERGGIKLIKNEYGFLAYKIQGEEAFVQEIFVLPDHRAMGVSRALIDELTEIAKGLECKYISGILSVGMNGFNEALISVLKIGFVVRNATNNCLVMQKGV